MTVFLFLFLFFFGLPDNELTGLWLSFLPIERVSHCLSLGVFSLCILHAACLQFSYLSDIQFQTVLSPCTRPLIWSYRIRRKRGPHSWNTGGAAGYQCSLKSPDAITTVAQPMVCVHDSPK